MDLVKLRKSDFAASLVIILFGLFILVMAFRMPMTASYGGVANHWYVAPALFPLIIGGTLVLMGIILCITAVRAGGLREFIAGIFRDEKRVIDEKRIRVWVIIFALSSFIYVLIPRIDFVLSIATFLFFLCAAFYSENTAVFRNLSRFLLAETVVLILLIVSGLGDVLDGLYPYSMDVLVLLFLIVMYGIARMTMKKEGLPAEKINTALLVAVLTPLFLCPVFRYALLTPLPKEGIIIDHMNWLYYTIKYRS